MAAGATTSHLVGGSAFARAAVGVTIEVATAVLATRTLQSLVSGVGLTDLFTYGVVIAVVTAVIACASYLPARRAAHTNPLTLLRD